MMSCSYAKLSSPVIHTVKRIKVLHLGEPVRMQAEFEKDFLNDLSFAEDKGPVKFVSTHQLILYSETAELDTMYTNGRVFRLHDRLYWAKEDLIEKYKYRK